MRRFRYLAIAGLASLGMLAAAGTASASGPQFTIRMNEAYAGWSAHPSGGVWEAGAIWNVPKVQCNAPFGSRAWAGSRAAMWVGIWGKDGSKDSKLIQVGTISRCVDGKVQGYTAFVEVYPDEVAQMVPLQVRPSLQVEASIFYRGQVGGKLHFSYMIGDVNHQVSGELYTTGDATYQGGAIVEDQNDGGSGALATGGLARFTTAKFTKDEVNYRDMYQYPDPSRTRWDMYGTLHRAHHPPVLDAKDSLAITGSATASGLPVTWRNWN
jgi:hypothetical protein